MHEARLSLFMSKCHIVGNLMSRLSHFYLTLISMASFLWDIGKLCRSRSEVAAIYAQNDLLDFYYKCKIPPNNHGLV